MIAPLASVEWYLTENDFTNPNKNLLENANGNMLLLIAGILVAKDLKQ